MFQQIAIISRGIWLVHVGRNTALTMPKSSRRFQQLGDWDLPHFVASTVRCRLPSRDSEIDRTEEQIIVTSSCSMPQILAPWISTLRVNLDISKILSYSLSKQLVTDDLNISCETWSFRTPNKNKRVTFVLTYWEGFRP
jgi:hypothetical protein